MELGAIGELVGGVAVVGSLLYVGLQVRQSNRLTKAEGLREYVREFNRTVLSPIQDQSVGNVLRRALNGFETLPKDEQLVGHAQFMKILLLGQTDFVLRRDGLVQDEFTEKMAGIDVGMLRSPGGSQWWEIARPVFLPEYAARIDAELRAGDEPAMNESFPWWGPDDGKEA